MYLLPSADVLTKKLGSNVNVIRHLIDPLLRICPFSEDQYLDMYPDIAEFIRKENIPVREHYVNNGYVEGRFPFKIVVDEVWYLNRYPDLVDSQFDDLNDHFIAAGYREGRLPFLPEIDSKYIDEKYSTWREHAKALRIKEDAAEFFVEYGYSNLMLPYNVFK